MRNNRHQHLFIWLAVACLLAMTVIAYYPGLHGPFLFDDNPNITGNPGIQIDSLGPQQLLRAAFSTDAGPLHRPISMLSFAFDYYFFGKHSFSFKLTNLIIHLINALLILWLTQRLLVNCRQRYRFKWNDTGIRWASVLIAAAWALHPLNLTAVLYVVQRMTSLAALFTIAGMISYIYGRERTLAGKSGWSLVWLVTPAFGILGVLSKEDAALLPLYLLVIEWLIFGFRNRRQAIAKNILIFFLIGLILPGILGLGFLISRSFWMGFEYRDFTLIERVLSEFRVILLYIQWTFFPDIRHLALYHDDLAISTGLLTPISTLLSLLALIALVILAWWQRKHRPLLSLGILFFFAGQMMESTILPLELIFEHRNYLPDFGLLLAALSLLLLPTGQTSRHARMSLRWAIAIIAIPVLFSVTFLRAYEWRSFLDFGYYEAMHHPKSERALYTLGQAYSNLALGGVANDSTLALHTLARAAAVSESIIPDTAMILVSAKLKLPVNPAWQQHAEMLLQKFPIATQDTAALTSLVDCIPTACKPLAPMALSMIQTAMNAKRSEKLKRTQADLWVIYANYLTFTDKPLNEIIAAMQQSVNYQPNTAVYRISLAKGYTMAGEFDAAEKEIRRISQLNHFGNLDLEIKALKANLAAGRAEAAKQAHTSG